MRRRMYVAVLLAIVGALITAGFAHAAGPGQQQDATWFGGVVTEVGSQWFSLRAIQGERLSFSVDGGTDYRELSELPFTAAELEQGDSILVRARLTTEGELLARLVVRLDPDLGVVEPWRVRGKVSEVREESGQFNVEAPSGDMHAFSVVEETSFLSLDPEFDSLADLEPGMIVGVAAVRDEAGEAHALMVTQHDLEDIGTHLNRARGQIQVVIPERSIFVIRTLKAERLSIKVHERTRFRSPDGSVEGIRDLERGMLVQVRGLRPQSEAQGGLLALEVLAADREDIVSVRGKIQKVDPSAGSFELQESGGNHLTVFVGERTRFISPGGEIKSVHDLEMGMVAGVQGVERGDGTILALRVAAGESGELRDHVMRTAGEITRIVPGQSTFWLLTKEGQLLKLQVRERTQFRSPDGSVQDIHDLKKGMTARLLAYATEGGDLIALRVWVRTERGRRMEGREAFDVLPEGRTDLLILAPRSPAP